MRSEYPNGSIQSLSNKEWSLQLDAERYLDLGALNAVRFGAKYRRETFDRDVRRRDFLYLLRTGAVSGFDMFPELSAASSTVSNFLDGQLASQDSWVTPDVAAYARSLAAAGITVQVLFAPQSSYSIENDISSAYAMARIDTDIGSMRLRGNVGMRYENTRRTTDTYLTQAQAASADANLVVGTARAPYAYSNWLPRLNLVLDMREDLLLRFCGRQGPGAADSGQQHRHRLNDFHRHQYRRHYHLWGGPGPDRSEGADRRSGRPEPGVVLRQRRRVDRGRVLEKNIKNGTFNSIVCPAAFNGTALSSNAAGDCVSGNGDIYEITATTNDPSKVKIRGYELGWTQSLDAWLPIDGFGFTTNFTRVIPQRDTDFKIRNLSEQTWNATAYWESEHDSARVSLNHRSEYEQDSSDSFFAREGHIMKARTQLDAVLGYQVNDKLSVQLGGLNLTNRKEQAYKDIPSRWQMTGVTGRSYYLSMQWDML